LVPAREERALDVLLRSDMMFRTFRARYLGVGGFEGSDAE